MKRIVSFLFIALLSFPVMAQNAYEADVQSIDSIIESLYASISGEKGEEREGKRQEKVRATWTS